MIDCFCVCDFSLAFWFSFLFPSWILEEGKCLFLVKRSCHRALFFSFNYSIWATKKLGKIREIIDNFNSFIPKWKQKGSSWILLDFVLKLKGVRKLIMRFYNMGVGTQLLSMEVVYEQKSATGILGWHKIQIWLSFSFRKVEFLMGLTLNPYSSCEFLIGECFFFFFLTFWCYMTGSLGKQVDLGANANPCLWF
jgi:hypothetical protein